MIFLCRRGPLTTPAGITEFGAIDPAPPGKEFSNGRLPCSRRKLPGTVDLERSVLYYVACVILAVKVQLRARACISSAAGGSILADMC
jgi:hypothetical protein